jgi:hypothetical protein
MANDRNTAFLSLSNFYVKLTGEQVNHSKLHTARYDTVLCWEIFVHLYTNNLDIYESKIKYLLG